MLLLSCGLRYARSRQKLEGKHPQRRVRRDPSNPGSAAASPTASKAPKKPRGDASGSRRGTVSSMASMESLHDASPAISRDDSVPWTPYGPTDSQPAQYSDSEPQQYSHRVEPPVGEDYSPYRPTSYDRGHRYNSLPHVAASGISHQPPSRYGYPTGNAVNAVDGVPDPTNEFPPR